MSQSKKEDESLQRKLYLQQLKRGLERFEVTFELENGEEKPEFFEKMRDIIEKVEVEECMRCRNMGHSDTSCPLDE